MMLLHADVTAPTQQVLAVAAVWMPPLTIFSARRNRIALLARATSFFSVALPVLASVKVLTTVAPQVSGATPRAGRPAHGLAPAGGITGVSGMFCTFAERP